MISLRKHCKFWRNMEVQRSHPAAQPHNPNRFQRWPGRDVRMCMSPMIQWSLDAHQDGCHFKTCCCRCVFGGQQWQEKMPSSISSTLFQPMKAPCFVEFLGAPQMPPITKSQYQNATECFVLHISDISTMISWGMTEQLQFTVQYQVGLRAMERCGNGVCLIRESLRPTAIFKLKVEKSHYSQAWQLQKGYR